MKTIINKSNKLILCFLFFFCLNLNVFPQVFEGNIDVPNGIGKGSMIGDLIHANGYIFAYALDKVIIYNANNLSVEHEIEFLKNYGKHNPFFYNESYWICDKNMMSYNATNNLVYIVTPDLDIWMVSAQNFSIISTYTPPEEKLPPYFKPINGINIIKYDDMHKRLYWVVTTRDPDNDIGSFHRKARFFGILKADNNGMLSAIHFDPIINFNNYEESAISDIEFNSENDLFYLTKLDTLQVWQAFDNQEPAFISGFHIPTRVPNYYNCMYYKFGKMFYINHVNQSNEKIHKIVALPYKYFQGGLDNPELYILDGNLTNPTWEDWKRIPVPSTRILDGVFLPGSEDLVISYAPDEDNITDPGNYNTDIATYAYDHTDEEFSIISTTYSSEKSFNYSDEYDINAPIDLHVIDDNNILINKSDEIVSMTYSTQYDFDQKYEGENNFFLKSVKSGQGNIFSLNSTINGLEVFNSSQSHLNTIKTGFQIHEIVGDNSGDRLFLLNKLSPYNTGLYKYDPNSIPSTVNINEDTDASNDIYAPIGDFIYNPFEDHFLISENTFYESGSAKIKILNNDVNNSFLSDISLEHNNTTTHYATDMYISPTGRLYVMTNMRRDSPPNPVVHIFAATTIDQYQPYDLITSIDITGFPIPTSYSEFEYYMAHFEYNLYNESVYISLSPGEFMMEPYGSVPNTTFVHNFTHSEIPTGLLIKITEGVASGTEYNYPSKILCPNVADGQPTSQYDNKMFIIGPNKFYVLDNTVDAMQPSSTYDEPFNELLYIPEYDILIGLRDGQYENDGTHRIAQLFKIYYDGEELKFDKIVEVQGQASCFFYNDIDDQFYLCMKYDEFKLGNIQVRMHHFRFDPLASTITPDYIDMGFTCSYPEVDHNGDFKLYLYNLGTPYLERENLCMYIPNGGHSSISKFSFGEVLNLQEGEWSWVSFPRLNRDDNDAVLIPIVLGGDNIDPNNYNTGSKLQFYVNEQNMPESNYDESGGWNSDGLLKQVQSTLGYKLSLKYNEPQEEKRLSMHGNLYDHFDPNCNNCTLAFDGSANEYWVGYYHLESQNIPDALPDELESKISIIKGQYFTCHNYGPGSDGNIWACACNKGSAKLKYGDMVIITPKSGEIINNFYWALNNNSTTDEDKAPTEYYSFTETADYTPIFVELDSTQDLLEIAAFVNDSCIGATTVLPADSLVLISAYADSLNGEIYFETYYGNNKSHIPPITKYFVENMETKIREQRSIHTREQQDYFVVSFKNTKDDEQMYELNPAWIKCSPNPIRSNSTVSCYVPDAGFVEIKLFNMMGMELFTLHSGLINAGKHNYSFPGLNSNGKSLSRGAYILSMKSALYQAQTKIIIVK